MVENCSKNLFCWVLCTKVICNQVSSNTLHQYPWSTLNWHKINTQLTVHLHLCRHSIETVNISVTVGWQSTTIFLINAYELVNTSVSVISFIVVLAFLLFESFRVGVMSSGYRCSCCSPVIIFRFRFRSVECWLNINWDVDRVSIEMSIKG